MAEADRGATRGLDRQRAELASIIFEAWTMLGTHATPQNAAGAIAAHILDANWRPPLPDTDDDSLNKLLEIDDVEKRYTEADYLEAYSTARRKYDESLRKALGQLEWGYRFYDHGGVSLATREEAESRAAADRAIEVVFRRVGSWEAAD